MKIDLSGKPVSPEDEIAAKRSMVRLWLRGAAAFLLCLPIMLLAGWLAASIFGVPSVADVLPVPFGKHVPYFPSWPLSFLMLVPGMAFAWEDWSIKRGRRATAAEAAMLFGVFVLIAFVLFGGDAAVSAWSATR
jgi:hypothetical protein